MIARENNGGHRKPGGLVKSPLLYQLSYPVQSRKHHHDRHLRLGVRGPSVVAEARVTSLCSCP